MRSLTKLTENEPLASRMRPRSLDEFTGQEHILAPGRLLRRAIEADRLSSVIFSGPPGTGKTTLAHIIAAHTKSCFQSLNAVLAGVKEVRHAIVEARKKLSEQHRRTILFVDEVHRWNKAQQDALLPWVENGTIIFIGATTENPFFELNKALVSRSRIFQLKSLGLKELGSIFDNAVQDNERGYGQDNIQIDSDAREHLIRNCSGDARNLLSALELAVLGSLSTKKLSITLAIAEESIQEKALLYDKSGDYHFDTISAFIKSLRGSDPDAALYWLARMIQAGESPRYIFRRMLISSVEDVGIADPQCLVFVEAAAAAFERVGMPEGQLFLAESVIYIATAPKSNSVLGYFDALQAARKEKILSEVPNHLRDTSRDQEGFGHGQGYEYPHAFKTHWVAQSYVPKGVRGQIFYHGGDLGLEGERYPEVLRRRELQLEVDDEPFEEILSFSGSASSGGARLERWISRSEGNIQRGLEELRKQVFQVLRKKALLARHSRILVIGNRIAPFLWEGLRQCPEGCCYALFKEAEEEEHFRFLLNRRDLNGAIIINSSDAIPESDIILIYEDLKTVKETQTGVLDVQEQENPLSMEYMSSLSGIMHTAPGHLAILCPDLQTSPPLGSWMLNLAEVVERKMKPDCTQEQLEGRNLMNTTERGKETGSLFNVVVAQRFLEAERSFFSSAHRMDEGVKRPLLYEERLSIPTWRVPTTTQLHRWFSNSEYREGLEASLLNQGKADIKGMHNFMQDHSDNNGHGIKLDDLLGKMEQSITSIPQQELPDWIRYYCLKLYGDISP